MTDPAAPEVARVRPRRRRLRLRTQLALLDAVSALVLVVVGGALLKSRTDYLRRAEAQHRAESTALVLAPLFAQAIGQQEALEQIATNEQGTDRQVELVDADGAHLAGTNLVATAAVAERVDAVLQGRNDDIGRTVDGSVIGIEPLDENDQTRGAVLVAEPSPPGSGITSLFGVSWKLALAIVISAGTVGWWVAGRVTRPLHALTTEASALALHRGTAPSVRSTIPEIATLAAAVDRVATRVRRDEDDRARIQADLRRVAHEMRTPLAIARLRFDDLLDGSHDEQRRAHAVIDGQLDRLDGLAGALSHLRPGDRQLELEELELRALTTDIVQRFMPLARWGDVDLRVLPGTPVTVTADRGQLRDAIGNVVENALRYTPRGGRVTARVAPQFGEVLAPVGFVADGTVPVVDVGDEPGAVVEIADSGEGIADELRHLVVQPGVRAQAGTIGSGQGLAIVADAMDRHGGRLELGRSPDGGALVRLVLPRRPPGGVAEPASPG